MGLCPLWGSPVYLHRPLQEFNVSTYIYLSYWYIRSVIYSSFTIFIAYIKYIYIHIYNSVKCVTNIIRTITSWTVEILRQTSMTRRRKQPRPSLLECSLVLAGVPCYIDMYIIYVRDIYIYTYIYMCVCVCVCVSIDIACNYTVSNCIILLLYTIKDR